MIQQGLNRKSENFAMRVLAHLAIKSQMTSKLKVVRLKGCEIGKTGVKHLKTIIKLPKSHIKEIDLSFNMLQSEGVNEFCKIFLHQAGHKGRKKGRDEESKSAAGFGAARNEDDLIRPDSDGNGGDGEDDDWDMSC